MKCPACGYIRERSGMDGSPEIGDKDFIELHNVVRAPFSLRIKGRQAVETGFDATLFACPKCGAVRLDRWAYPVAASSRRKRRMELK